MDDNNEDPHNEYKSMLKTNEKNLFNKNLKLSDNNENQKEGENVHSINLPQKLKLYNKNKNINKKSEENVNNLLKSNNKNNNHSKLKQLINNYKSHSINANINSNNNLLKNYDDENVIENKEIKQIINYRKALILSLNSGFFKPRNIYKLFTKSPYIYNNINIRVMLEKTIIHLERENKKLTNFISKHVSIYLFKI